MKFVIVLACLLAVAYASDADITDDNREVNPDGFKYNYQISDGTSVHQEGHLKGEDTVVFTGSYEYISEDGKVVKVTYTADENGYHPEIKV